MAKTVLTIRQNERILKADNTTVGYINSGNNIGQLVFEDNYFDSYTIGVVAYIKQNTTIPLEYDKTTKTFVLPYSFFIDSHPKLISIYGVKDGETITSAPVEVRVISSNNIQGEEIEESTWRELATKFIDDYIVNVGVASIVSDINQLKGNVVELKTDIAEAVDELEADIAECLSDAKAYASTKIERLENDVVKLEEDVANDILHAKAYTDAKIDYLEVGGRNIMLNSNTKKITGYQSPTITHEESVTVIDWGAVDAYRAYGKGGTNVIFATFSAARSDRNTIINGKTYIHSIYIKNNHTTNKLAIGNNINTNVWINPGETKRVVMKENNETKVAALQFVFKVENVGGEFDFIYWHPQIEIGEMVSDWLPAPEDLISEAKTYADTKVNDLVIGGTNILPSTQKPTDTVLGGRGILTDTVYKNCYVVTCDNISSSASKDVVKWDIVIAPEPDTEYTLSFWAKGSGRMSSFFYSDTCASGYSNKGVTTSTSTGEIVHTLESNWTKYIITWKTLSTVSGNKTVLPCRILAGGNLTGACAFKFEVGNKATDWCPAPKDVEASKVSKSGDTMTGDLKFDSTLNGVYGKDKNGVQYPFVYDNGGNFWVGASGSGSTGVHHTGGGTYISGGEGYVYASRLIDGVRTNAIIIDTKNMGSQLVTTLQSGADLDDYKTTGFYRCTQNVIAQSLLNSPTTQSFSMVIETHAGAKQTITTYSTSGQLIYTRNHYSGSWGAWRELAFVDNTRSKYINGINLMSADATWKPTSLTLNIGESANICMSSALFLAITGTGATSIGTITCVGTGLYRCLMTDGDSSLYSLRYTSGAWTYKKW